MKERWAYSNGGEIYHGDFPTAEEAVAEAKASGLNAFYVGRAVPPMQPEHLWCAEDWLEYVSCQDYYSGEWAEDWEGSTEAQREELERLIRPVMAEWLDRHDLRPKHFTIDEKSEKFIQEPA